MEFGEVILNQKGLSVRERELAILAVTSAYETPFIKYAHSRVALASGLENDQIEQACTGQSPDRITDAEAAVYDLSLELVLTRTVLKEGSWKRYEEVLGKEKCLRVAHVSGLYMYSASFLRLANLQAPA
jgi:alkylhydroperoxidase family enzyme